MFSADTYAPLDELKPVADDIWVVDGPVIGFRYLGMTFPFPTRMTVIRLSDKGLFIHSPIRLTKNLQAKIDALGPVKCLIAPDTIHYASIPDWQKAYRQARTYCAPGVTKRAKSTGISVQFDGELADTPENEWRGEIEQVMVRGGYLSEVDFYHTASETLILTDLIINFEAHKIKSPIWRWLIRAFGAMDPHGSTPYDMRATFIGHKDSLRKAVQRMIGWQPKRVILAHGRWYKSNGTEELKRAFDWVLK